MNYKVVFEIEVKDCDLPKDKLEKALSEEEGLHVGTEWNGVRGKAKLVKLQVTQLP